MSLMEPAKTANCLRDSDYSLLAPQEITNSLNPYTTQTRSNLKRKASDVIDDVILEITDPDPIEVPLELDPDSEIEPDTDTEEDNGDEKYLAKYSEFCRKKNITIGDNATTHVAGYLARKTFKKFKCYNCQSFMQKLNNEPIELREFYVLHRDYGVKNEDLNEVKYLNLPTSGWFQIVKSMTFVLMEYLKENIHTRNVASRAVNILRNINVVKKWCYENEGCITHQYYVVDLFVTMYTHHHVKRFSVLNAMTKNCEIGDEKTAEKNTKEYEMTMKFKSA